MNSEEVSKKIQELEALRKETQVWKIGGILVILAIIIFNVLSIVGKAKTLADPESEEQKQLKAAFMEGVTNNIVPMGKDAITNAIAKATAHLDKEKELLMKRLPELKQVLVTEIDILNENLPDEANKILEETFVAELNSKEELLRKTFPKLNEDSLIVMLGNLTDEVESTLDDIAQDYLLDHMIAMNEIMFNLEKISLTEDTDLYNDDDAPWLFGTLVWEILEEEFRDTTPEIVKDMEEKKGGK